MSKGSRFKGYQKLRDYIKVITRTHDISKGKYFRLQQFSRDSPRIGIFQSDYGTQMEVLSINTTFIAIIFIVLVNYGKNRATLFKF